MRDPAATSETANVVGSTADDDSTPIISLVGNRVALGPLRRDLIPRYQRWINDPVVARGLAVAPVPMTLEAETAWYDNAAAGKDGPSFTIYIRDGMRPIGGTGFHALDWRHRRTEWGIMIGEKDAQGQGYGTETARLMLDYAFNGLGLRSVALWVFEWNAAARRAYEKAGFRETGRRRQCRWFAGRYWDEILMDCLAEEFESPFLGGVFRPDDPRP